MSVLKVTASSNLHEVVQQYRERGQSVDRLLPAAGELLLGAVQDVFDAEGPGWEQLADSTIAARRNSSSAAIKILQDTGILAGTIDKVVGADYVEAVAAASYGIFHVEGTATMPKRDFTDLGPFEAGLLEDVAAMMLEQLQ